MVVANETRPDQARLDSTLSVILRGKTVAGGQFTPSVAGITFGAQPVDAEGRLSLVGLRQVLVGPFEAVVRSGPPARESPDPVAVVRPDGGFGIGGVMSVPGVAGIILILFAFAYAESFLRPIRKGRRPGPGVLIGMGLVGAVAGLGTAVVGWALGSHLLSGALLFLCGLGGLATAALLTVAVVQAAAAPVTARRSRR